MSLITKATIKLTKKALLKIVIAVKSEHENMVAKNAISAELFHLASLLKKTRAIQSTKKVSSPSISTKLDSTLSRGLITNISAMKLYVSWLKANVGYVTLGPTVKTYQN